MKRLLTTGLVSAAMLGGAVFGAGTLAGIADAQGYDGGDTPTVQTEDGQIVQVQDEVDPTDPDAPPVPEDGEREGCEGRGGRGRGLDAAAEAIGVDVESLRDSLREGQTIAQVAEANGVDPQTVIDAMVADLQTHLDEEVAAGELTAEEAADRLTDATERITQHVLEGRPEGERGPRPPRGPAPEAEPPADQGTSA